MIKGEISGMVRRELGFRNWLAARVARENLLAGTERVTDVYVVIFAHANGTVCAEITAHLDRVPVVDFDRWTMRASNVDLAQAGKGRTSLAYAGLTQLLGGSASGRDRD